MKAAAPRPARARRRCRSRWSCSGRLPWFYLPYVRFERPLLGVPAAAAVWFVAGAAWRGCRRASTALRRWPAERCTLGRRGAGRGLRADRRRAGRPLDRLTIIVAIDRSRSIDLVPGADARIDSELRVAELGMRDDDRIGTIAFGASAAVEDPLRERTHPARPAARRHRPRRHRHRRRHSPRARRGAARLGGAHRARERRRRRRAATPLGDAAAGGRRRRAGRRRAARPAKVAGRARRLGAHGAARQRRRSPRSARRHRVRPRRPTSSCACCATAS